MWSGIWLLITLISPTAGLGWAAWSPWTTCSKSCGGGVSQQLRRCLDEKCSGHSTRYRICNVMDCDKPSRSPRDTVCSGEIIVSRQQCEVVCRSRSTGTRFLWRVADGTPCQAASSRAVCSQGSCQIVGCDEVIGSSLRFDACGVCGGRGDTCDNAQFVWKDSGEFTPCAGSCDDLARAWHSGMDVQESHSISVCINSQTSRVVPERLCADRTRNKPITRPCPPLICPSKWISSEWTECSPTCGGGRRTRSVYCVHRTASQSVNVPDTYCDNQTRPVSTESCGHEPCGQWQAGSWSRCSATCGEGVRKRTVECVGGSDCSWSQKPITAVECYAGIPCQLGNALIPQALALQENRMDWNDRPFLDGSSYNPMEPRSNNPKIVPSRWSECSATCGSGVQSRTADCIAIHPITTNIIKLPFVECQNQIQPQLYQSCEMRPCPLQEDAKIVTDNSPFRWEHGDWTSCSASCLGGKQRAALKCMEVATGRPVTWSNCDARTRPPEKSRPCNQQLCPPFWQVGPYEACTASCGGGESSRAVKCVQLVSREGGADAQVTLADSACPAPKPPEKQLCGALQCPATWITGEWTECSASCGAGEQRRRVACEGRDARGRREPRTEKECPGDRPQNVRMCSLGSCEKPELLSNRIFDQDPSIKKLTLAIGGMANVYQGTSIKVKCPSKNYDKKKVSWTKDGKKIRNDAHIKVSANGNLRIFHARLEDGGVYACFTDSPRGNLTLRLKYRNEGRNKNRLLPSEMERGPGAKSSGAPSKSVIEKLLASGNDADIAKELQKYRYFIKATWDIGHWSECKQTTCTVSGYEARPVSCVVQFENIRRTGDNLICQTLVGVRPHETRPCHRADCPRWEAGDWSNCEASKCVRDNIAQQKREVKCVLANGTELDTDRCDRTNRPKSRIECQTKACKAEWRASDWGSCSSNCGTGGVQLRLLSCVWANTGRAAGRGCEGARRPSAARACPERDLPPCKPEALRLQQDASCEDQSRFCDIIKVFHSCDTLEVRQKCCASCTYVERRRG